MVSEQKLRSEMLIRSFMSTFSTKQGHVLILRLIKKCNLVFKGFQVDLAPFQETFRPSTQRRDLFASIPG